MSLIIKRGKFMFYIEFNSLCNINKVNKDKIQIKVDDLNADTFSKINK